MHHLSEEQDMWIVQRFGNLISHAKLEVRREALNFFTALVRGLRGHPKDRVLEKLDLV